MTPEPVRPGAPFPLGATRALDGINFALVAPFAQSVELRLFNEQDRPASVHLLTPGKHRTGSVWHARLADPGAAVSYDYAVVPAPGAGPIPVLDPYARRIVGSETWGREAVRRCALPDARDRAFDWGRSTPPRTPLSSTVIYEVGVREYTAHPSSGVSAPGTFAGLREKIPYLVELGVTAVELLPVFEFDEMELRTRDPETGEKLLNLWGYSTVSYFAPKTSLAGRAGDPVREFKTLVRSLHEAGIEVILDVVFNHTAELDEEGPILHFKGLAREIYYLLDSGGELLDFTGCGNTVNCNHPLVSDLIVDCLRYWVTEMRVDGFRFDLASVLTRGEDGEPLLDPPVLSRIARDPVLAETKLIAEAWDAAGLYQVGTFPAYGRFSELNGRFRDDVRRFLRGDPGTVAALATRIAGSSDLYQKPDGNPFRSINFVTCHDGFTLADLVSYDRKHNRRNGEENRDGSDDNISWNSGTEGATDDPDILRRRRIRHKSFLAVLLLSQGVPFFHAGDEFGRTKSGNNNTYCQDTPTGWVDWQALEQNPDLYRFTRLFIAMRRRHPALRQRDYLTGRPQPGEDLPDIAWLGPGGDPPDWNGAVPTLGFFLPAGPGSSADDVDTGRHDLMVLINASRDPVTYRFPSEPERPWRRSVDTSLPEPFDIAEAGQEEDLVLPESYDLSPHSVVVLLRPKD